jgi:hypothetical protein
MQDNPDLERDRHSPGPLLLSLLTRLCCRGQSESLRDGSELVSALDPFVSETAREDPSHRRHKGATSGEEDTINLLRLDAGAPQQGIDTPLDGSEVVDDPALKLGS